MAIAHGIGLPGNFDLDSTAAGSHWVRFANYPAGVPGNGSYLARTKDGRSVGVINVMGRVFMLNIDDPFKVVLREIDAAADRVLRKVFSRRRSN